MALYLENISIRGAYVGVMSDENDSGIKAARREFIKVFGVAAGGIVASKNVRYQVSEESKHVAEGLRKIPGLGYSGRSTALSYSVGGKDILRAEKENVGYWRGAPALEYDPASDTLITHVRHRDPINRGKRVSLHRLDQQTLKATEILSINKQELAAKSIEGGELIKEDGEFRWFISYQKDSNGKWVIQERRGPSISDLSSGGHQLNINSDLYHNKDPAIVNGEFYVISNSRDWLDTKIQKINIDKDQPRAEEVSLNGAGNGRITTGGLLENELFLDFWPDLPHTNISNFLWTTDERSTNGMLESGSVHIDTSNHYVSSCGSSITYVDALMVQEWVYLLWQEEKCAGNNDLVGSRITLEEYENLVF